MAKRKRGGGQRKGRLAAGWALLVSLLAEAVSLVLVWLILGNLVALQIVERAGFWLGICGLLGCLVGWLCWSRLAGAAGRGWVAFAWLLFVALAVLELRMLAAGLLGARPALGG